MKVRVSFDTIHTSLKKWSNKNWSTSKNERRSKTHLEEYMYSTNTYYLWDHTNSCAHALNTKERERERVVVSFVFCCRVKVASFFLTREEEEEEEGDEEEDATLLLPQKTILRLRRGEENDFGRSFD